MLIHVGLCRTGTSWLQHNLFTDQVVGFKSIATRHELYAQFITPPPFTFDAEALRTEITQKAQAIEAQGLFPVMSQELFSGSPEEGGYQIQFLADRLHQVVPDAKILIVIREQRAIVESFYNQYVRVGGLHNLHDYVFPPHHLYPEGFLIDMLRYDRFIAYYQKLFGKENVCVLAMEQMKESALKYVEVIAQFCNLTIPDNAPIHENAKKRNNTSLSNYQLIFTRRLNRWVSAPQLYWRGFLPVLGNKSYGGIRRITRRIERALPKGYLNTLEKKLEKEVADLIGTQYQQSNAETMRITGLDLKRFGYDLPED